MSSEYRLIRTRFDRGVLYATVDHPPLNLIDADLYGELVALGRQVESDDAVRVLVLESALPDFFLAHFDVRFLLQRPIDRPPQRNQRNDFIELCERLQRMPKASIAKIAGRVGGGANELVAAFDMRFGARGRARILQLEVGLGVMPGGGATQRLPRLVGRGRALEMILGADDVDADTAERWGYLNRALAPAELDAFVERLALRIASFPREGFALAKQSVGNADRMPLLEGIWEENYYFRQVLRDPHARRLIERYLAAGGQTPAGALRANDLVREVVEADAAESP